MHDSHGLEVQRLGMAIAVRVGPVTALLSKSSGRLQRQPDAKSLVEAFRARATLPVSIELAGFGPGRIGPVSNESLQLCGYGAFRGGLSAVRIDSPRE